MPGERKEADRLRSEMEELFADLCQVPRLVGKRGFRPAVDVHRTDDPPTVHVVVEVPGIDPRETEVSFGDGVLTVRGSRRRPAGGRRYQHMEMDYGPFERRIALADPVDADAVAAAYEDGLLVIRLPVAERPAGPVRVEVNTGKGE